MRGRLNERVAIVTGGARGIGAAVARLFAAEGAAVVVADVLDTEGEKPAAEPGGPSRYAHVDVSTEDDWRTAVDETERDLGPVSVPVNNAGVIAWATIEEESLESFRRVIDVNLQGTWLGIRTAAAPGRPRRDREHVLHRGHHRLRRHRIVCGQQVGAAGADQGRGAGTGPGRDPGLFGASRCGAHRDDG